MPDLHSRYKPARHSDSEPLIVSDRHFNRPSILQSAPAEAQSRGLQHCGEGSCLSVRPLTPAVAIYSAR